jgi:hypothetical protein
MKWLTVRWPAMRSRATKKWWLREHGSLWKEWALILPGGDVVVYDETGHTVRRSNYGSRGRAKTALKVKGFKLLNRKELEVLPPPQVG